MCSPVRAARAGAGQGCLLSLLAPSQEWGPPPNLPEARVVMRAGRGATSLSSAIRGLRKTPLSLSPGPPLTGSSLCLGLYLLQQERAARWCLEDGTGTRVVAVGRFGFQMFLCSVRFPGHQPCRCLASL